MTKDKKEIYKIIIFAAIMLAAALNVQHILKGMNTFWGMLSPIFLGAVLAFIVNVPMKKIEALLEKAKMPEKASRPLALLLVLLFVALIFTLLILIVMPTLSKTFTKMISVVEETRPKIIEMVEKLQIIKPEVISQITSKVKSFDGWKVAIDFFKGLVSNAGGIFSNTFTILMGFFFMLSILATKDHLAHIFDKLIRGLFKEETARQIKKVGSAAVETYDKFLGGQIIEAVIVSSMIFITFTIFKVPYASMTAVLAGVLSFIPYIGPLASCIFGALFVFVESPFMALVSIVLFQAVQLVEGNLIYPRVVGQSVGLPQLFTLAATLIGGQLFGITGMVFFTPIFAVVYRFTKEYIDKRISEKEKIS